MVTFIKKTNVNQYAMQGLKIKLLQHSFEASASSLPHPATIHYCHWIRILIENKDTLLLLMTYQFLTSGVPFPLTVYQLIMLKYPLMKGTQLYHANHLTLCDTKWSLPLTRCLTHIIWIIIIQKSKRPIINGDTNNAHVVCI